MSVFVMIKGNWVMWYGFVSWFFVLWLFFICLWLNLIVFLYLSVVMFKRLLFESWEEVGRKLIEIFFLMWLRIIVCWSFYLILMWLVCFFVIMLYRYRLFCMMWYCWLFGLSLILWWFYVWLNLLDWCIWLCVRIMVFIVFVLMVLLVFIGRLENMVLYLLSFC